MPQLSIPERANSVAKWAAIAIGFSIPISTALDNILLAVLLLAWLFGAGHGGKLRMIQDNPVAVAALLLFLYMLAGCFYGDGTTTQGLHYLGKYSDLFLIALLVPLFATERARQFAMLGFMLAMFVTLLLSYFIYLSGGAFAGVFSGSPGNPFVFKNYLTQNIFMAFFSFQCLVLARAANSRSVRGGLFLCAALAAYNVLFMSYGRTGYLVLGVLFAYFLLSLFRWKGAIVLTLLIGGLFGAAYFGSGGFTERVRLATHEFTSWQPGKAVTEMSSVGLRMEFYWNSLAIIADRPLMGVGMGGFEKAYGEKIHGTGMRLSNNPHNQFLLLGAQLGVLGLLLLFYLFWVHWRSAKNLPTLWEHHLARGAVLTIVCGSVVNSLLLDHAEGLFYAWITGVLFAGLKVSGGAAEKLPDVPIASRYSRCASNRSHRTHP